ncbi:MAG TPA: GNAT family N-acetyltransferase [Gaiellaceae bacterium]|nr:GNAT family N-acetyltransferase [Gaiellaceae bacterium]
MSRLEVVPFADEHLEAAAALLAARHARQRGAEPLLSPRYEDPAAARKELERVWRGEAASGAAGLRDGRLVGYLVGARREHPVWGKNTWVEAAGHAAEEAEDVRDLYGLAAARWVDEGRPRHWAVVPAHDTALLDAWWRVGFGQQHAHGIREVPAEVEVRVPGGYEIRGPREDEIEQLIELDLTLPEHQQRAPVFGGLGLPTREESREEWLKTLAGDEETILIGAHEGRPVACWAYVDVTHSNEHRGLVRPDHACFLGFAATLPEARGSGIGVALTQAGFAWAAEQGYPTMLTDWRVTNLLASRFWPQRGFRTSFLRLYRHIP